MDKTALLKMVTDHATAGQAEYGNPEDVGAAMARLGAVWAKLQETHGATDHDRHDPLVLRRVAQLAGLCLNILETLGQDDVPELLVT